MKYFFKKIYDFIRYDVPKGIANLWIWFPVIWQDRWWDSYYIYALLHKKLSLMEKNFLKYGHHVGAEKDAHKMKVCRLLLERIIKDDYSPMTVHEIKWGEAELNWDQLEDGSEYYSLNIIHPKVITVEDKERERKDFKRAMDQEEYLKKQDIEYLFKMMKKHIRSWWD